MFEKLVPGKVYDVIIAATTADVPTEKRIEHATEPSLVRLVDQALDASLWTTMRFEAHAVGYGVHWLFYDDDRLRLNNLTCCFQYFQY